MATTANYGWEIPTQGADAGAWGTKLNAIFTKSSAPLGLDEVIDAISTIADAALPKAGGVFTGDVEYAVGARLIEDDSAIAALEVDWALGNFHSKTLANGGQTFTFANYPSSGKVQFLTIELTQGSSGNSTITWPASVEWDGGVAPTLSTGAAGRDVLVFYTRNGGTSVVGSHSITNPA